MAILQDAYWCVEAILPRTTCPGLYGTTWPLLLLCPTHHQSPPDQLASGSPSVPQAPCTLSFIGTSSERPSLATLEPPCCQCPVSLLHCISRNLQRFPWFCCDCLSLRGNPKRVGLRSKVFVTYKPVAWQLAWHLVNYRNTDLVTTSHMGIGFAGV